MKGIFEEPWLSTSWKDMACKKGDISESFGVLYKSGKNFGKTLSKPLFYTSNFSIDYINKF